MPYKTIGRIENGRFVRETETTDADRARMADILESHVMPGGMTDDSWLAQHGTLEKQFAGDPDGLNAVIAGAKKHGITPNPNSVYMPSLAKEVGDPQAFVMGRGDVERVCRDRNVDCIPTSIGAPKHTRITREPKTVKPHLAPDLAAQMAKKMVERNPELKRLDKSDLIAEVNRVHAPKG